jgi:hypothetical protein
MDILEAIAIDLRCASCGARYKIPLRQVLISEQMLHEGCPVPMQFTNECSPLYYAHLVERNLILELERIWLRLKERSSEVGGKLVLRRIQSVANSDPCADEDGEAGRPTSH